MFSIKELYTVIDEYAPFRLSQAFIEQGSYDNSGILIKSSDKVNKILFSLDLSVQTVKKAKRMGCDTIVTHHPAIYSPIKQADVDCVISGAVAFALNYKMNVISAHLNLDGAKNGIDYYLADGLGAKEQKIFMELEPNCGYGREFSIQPITLAEYVKKVKDTFNTSKVITYGKKNAVINRVASFCGGGSGDVEKLTLKKDINAELIVSSDMPHHVIKQCIEQGYSVMLLTHYASENYGFFKAYEYISQKIGDKANCVFYTDQRFK